jgi:hypothetical protein
MAAIIRKAETGFGSLMLRVTYRVVGTVFCIALLGLSAKLLEQDLATLGTREVVERLNQGETVTPALIDSLTNGSEFAASLKLCRSNVLEAALTIQLNHLDGVNRAVDDERWQDAMAKALSLVEHAERCTPGDGNLWLRDAMLVRAVAEQPAAIVQRLELSANLIPNYMPVVLTRLGFLSSTTAETQAAGSSLLDDDLRVTVFYLPPYRTAPFLKSLPDVVRSRAIAIVPQAPAVQQELIQKFWPKT